MSSFPNEWRKLRGLVACAALLAAGCAAGPNFKPPPGGTLLHHERAAKAAYVQARVQYRSTVVAGALPLVARPADRLQV
ncbi:MAG TPA: hypothetical protein VMU52_03930 [Steroidobacteraceae bacterium]|nr:hypothetical protein [Steroidobacteraceae bacterium]